MRRQEGAVFTLGGSSLRNIIDTELQQPALRQVKRLSAVDTVYQAPVLHRYLSVKDLSFDLVVVQVAPNTNCQVLLTVILRLASSPVCKARPALVNTRFKIVSANTLFTL